MMETDQRNIIAGRGPGAKERRWHLKLENSRKRIPLWSVQKEHSSADTLILAP